MAFKLKISQKGILLVALPSLFQIVFVLVLSNLVSQAEVEAKRQAHAREVTALAHNLIRVSIDTVMSVATFHATQEKMYLERAKYDLQMANISVGKLKKLCESQKEQSHNAAAAQQMVRTLYSTVSSMSMPDNNATVAGGIFGDRLRLNKIRLIAIKIDAALMKVVLAEQGTEEDADDKAQKARNLTRQLLLLGVAVNVGLAFVLAYYFSQSVAKRLLVVRENTSRLARRQQLVPAIGGDDEIAELDNAFHSAAHELSELEQFKQQLIGIVSHELKTPLSAMQVNIALMSGGITGELPPKAQQKVRILETNVNRLIRLINDLLDIEKLEAGKFELVIRPCSIAVIVESSIESVRAFAEERKVAIDFMPERDYMIDADYDRIVQVVINLLSNAVKYSPENSQVLVESKEIENLVELRVIDRGRGVPESHREKIFDRFQQVEKSDETTKGGTGLGLAICKAIVEQHNGTIGVESAMGEGSVFWFRLHKAAGALEDRSERAGTAVNTGKDIEEDPTKIETLRNDQAR